MVPSKKAVMDLTARTTMFTMVKRNHNADNGKAQGCVFRDSRTLNVCLSTHNHLHVWHRRGDRSNSTISGGRTTPWSEVPSSTIAGHL
ncbi:hypothetical protein TNCV_1132641 [Trichonephila clavipes]|nr:hypothetical protein TNCV_1132641 [Trichonephila clavipes]